MKCPNCKAPVSAPTKDQSEEREYFPFCSKRCKMIDLGGWLSERYKIPTLEQADDLPESDPSENE